MADVLLKNVGNALQAKEVFASIVKCQNILDGLHPDKVWVHTFRDLGYEIRMRWDDENYRYEAELRYL